MRLQDELIESMPPSPERATRPRGGRSSRRGSWLLATLVLQLTGAIPAAVAEATGPGSVAAMAPEPAGEPADLRQIVRAWSRGLSTARTVAVLDPLIADRIHLLRQRSPTFEAAWAELEYSGIPVLIGTSAQLEQVLPGSARANEWVGLTLTWGNGGAQLVRAAVVLRLEWLEGIHASLGNPEAAFLDALDRLIIHEIYGHLAPVVGAGNLRAACSDAGPGEAHEHSCVGQREERILAELP